MEAMQLRYDRSRSHHRAARPYKHLCRFAVEEL
jgi:hypothetical protein